MKYSLVELNIPPTWTIVKHEFVDLDPMGDSTAEEKELRIFMQEDLLLISKFDYHLDLGWYGGNPATSENAGFRIVLFRGEDWLNAEFLVKYSSINVIEISKKIRSLIQAIEADAFKNIKGYKVDENNENRYDLLEEYDARYGLL